MIVPSCPLLVARMWHETDMERLAAAPNALAEQSVGADDHADQHVATRARHRALLRELQENGT